MAPYHLSLNKVSLIFFPDEPLSSALSEPHVVQVVVKQSRQFTVHELATFFRAQEDITAVIENILLAHIMSPLPSTTIIVEGDSYCLYGDRKEWSYGRALRLTWGQQEIRTCDEKWTFVFDPNPVKPHVKS